MTKRDWLLSIIAGLILGGLLISFGLTKGTSVSASGNLEEILNLILNSHTKWQTIQGQAEVVWYSQDGSTQTYLTDFAIAQPAQAFFDTTNKEGTGNEGLWISDGEKAYALDKVARTYSESRIPAFALDLSMLPTSLSEVEQGITYGHPFALIIPSPLKDYIYSSWVAEGKGMYSLMGQEKISDRAAWVIEYKESFEGELSEHFQIWVDQKTGVILKFIQFNLNKEWKAELFVEATMTSINFDQPIAPEKFSVPETYQPSTKP
ncbi:MAG: hypothetical protein Fur0022_33470 [Anaerolineales bacterium]